MSITGKGLVAYARSKIGVPYVYGTKMEVLTLEKFNWLQKTYGVAYVWNSDKNKVGKVCCDCSGLISSYTGVLQGSSQMKAAAKVCEPIVNINSAPIGAILRRSGHVGIYIGYEDSVPYYIAEDGSAYGCRKNKLANASFTHYLIMDYIDYREEPAMDNKEVTTVDEALTVLVKKDILNGTEYWLNAVKCVKFLDGLLIKFANYANKG